VNAWRPIWEWSDHSILLFTLWLVAGLQLRNAFHKAEQSRRDFDLFLAVVMFFVVFAVAAWFIVAVT